MLKKRTSTLTDEFDLALSQLDGYAPLIIRRYKSEIKAITDALNKEKNQVIIAGYPPFLKDLTAYAQEKGHNFDEFSVMGIVGGQAISEAMRDQLIQHGFNHIYSSYGASDLDINLGVETEYEISVRKAIETNPGLARELYGENKGLPNEDQCEEYAHSLLNKLVNLNQDFRYQVEKLDEGTALPLVRFFKRHQSPISEAGGHRKQVLIFQ
ncbi:MAG: hypothetical protein LEGION0403_FIIPPAGN_01373 [Legionella sp.]|uniref:hypothetical protein n=1 Tax=Legionella sp. TaxID=459 RepID=UPI003D0FFE00